MFTPAVPPASTPPAEALTALIDELGETVMLVDSAGTVRWASAAAQRLLGSAAVELVGRELTATIEGASADVLRAALGRARASGAAGAVRGVRVAGSEAAVRILPLPGDVLAVLLRPEAGDACADEVPHGSPRHEAVGRLAGGLAHEFNNLLTVIRGNVAFARGGLLPGSAAHDDLTEVERAVGRAAVLVRQLLALGRQQLLRLQSVEVRTMVREAMPRLRRRCLSDVLIDVVFGDEPCVVRADPEQFQQVLVNIVSNACDAMPAGGCVTVDTGVVHLDGTAAREWSELPSGDYVRVTVRDTGHGMDETSRARAFDPFFTTKPQGAGLGLGLAVAHGIVAQSGGAMRVESTPGQGTAVSMLLPRLADVVLGEEPWTEIPGGSEALLVADAVPALRGAVARLLAARGYAVEAVASAAAAVERAHVAHPALLLCGTSLPDTGDVAVMVRRTHPSLPVLLLARAGDDVEALAEAAAPAAWVLRVPLVSNELLATVRAVLDGAAARTPVA